MSDLISRSEVNDVIDELEVYTCGRPNTMKVEVYVLQLQRFINKLKNIRDKFSSDINDVQKEYIDTVVQELELKIDAVDNLINAIECFKVYSNSTGTSYASQANELMYEATMYQHERDEIVNNNTELFKPQKFML